MAQSGYTPILIYASGTASNVPLAANLTSSASGAELALNYADGKLYFKNSSGVVTLLAGSGGGGPAAGSNTQIQFNSSGVFGASANLTWSGTVLSTTGLTATGAITLNTTTNNQSYTTTGAGTITISSGTAGTINNMTIGGTTAAAGTFTNLTYTGTLTGSTGVIAIGTNQIYKDSSGNVGLGTSSPSTYVSSGGLALAGAYGTSSAAISIYNTTAASTSNIAKIDFRLNNTFLSGTPSAAIWALNPNAAGNNGGALVLATSANGTSTTPTEAVRIDSSGNVGIGTSSVTSRLDVISANGLYNGGIRVNGNSSGNASSGMYIVGGQSTTHYNWLIGSQFNVGNAFEITPSTAVNGTTFSTPFLVINSSGNVGIGTTSPSYKLDVQAATVVATGDTTALRLFQAGDGGVAMLFTNGVSNLVRLAGTVTSAGAGTDDGVFTIQTATNGTLAERMRIDSSGNVGIGTSSPTNPLTVAGTANAAYTSSKGIVVNYGNSSTSVVVPIGFSWASSIGNQNPYWGMGLIPINFGAGTADLGFYTTGSERMRIDSSGNVGIKTSSPQATLDVNGNISLSSNSIIGYALGSQTGTISGVTSPYYGINFGNFTGLGGLGIGVHGYSGQIFSTAGTERMRIDSSGNLLVGTTSSTNAAKVTAVSNSTGTSYQMMMNNTDTGTGSQISMDIYRNSTRVGSITTTNTATAYNISSDYRLKENVQPMTGALAKVSALKPVTYKWKIDGSDGEGFIAHELQAIVPHAVHGEKDAVNEDGSINPQGIDTSFLVATLTAAIQEQQALITSLTARIEALESKG